MKRLPQLSTSLRAWTLLAYFFALPLFALDQGTYRGLLTITNPEVDLTDRMTISLTAIPQPGGSIKYASGMRFYFGPFESSQFISCTTETTSYDLVSKTLTVRANWQTTQRFTLILADIQPGLLRGNLYEDSVGKVGEVVFTKKAWNDLFLDEEERDKISDWGCARNYSSNARATALKRINAKAEPLKTQCDSSGGKFSLRVVSAKYGACCTNSPSSRPCFRSKTYPYPKDPGSCTAFVTAETQCLTANE